MPSSTQDKAGFSNDPQTGEERYILRSRLDVLPVLQSLAKWPIPVRLQLNQLSAFFSSRLIVVTPAFEEMVFDASGLDGAERLDGSAGLVAEAQMDAVWFRFEAEHAVSVGATRIRHFAPGCRQPSNACSAAIQCAIRCRA